MELTIIIRVCKYLLWMILAAGPLYALIAKLGELAQKSLGTIATSLAALATAAETYLNNINVAGIATQVSQANRMFPFTEVLILMGSYAAVKVLVFTVRTIKSWIPTLS